VTAKNREKTEDPEDFQKVLKVVRDFIFEKHSLPQINDIVDIAGVKKQRCNEVVDQLIKQRELYVAFGGPNVPKVVVPYDMMQGMLATQRKPDWLHAYGFVEKVEIFRKMEELQKEAIRYEQFERLLYAADIPLEEAIAYSLEWLGFRDVKHRKDNTDNPDVTFVNDGIKAIVEAQGTTKAGSKEKVAQLNQWMERELHQGAEAAKLRGFFAINHFRDKEPKKREDPLTQHAKEFLRYHSNLKFFSTTFLFDVVKKVANGQLRNEEARTIIWNGEEIR